MPNPLHRWQYETFREMLVVARKAAGLTQVEVAKRLDKPQSFVSKYEHGERRLDFTEFVEIADILSIDVGRFSMEYRQQLVDAQARNA
jgi:transcriptional regulator with XRE-family HTH domain